MCLYFDCLPLGQSSHTALLDKLAAQTDPAFTHAAHTAFQTIILDMKWKMVVFMLIPSALFVFHFAASLTAVAELLSVAAASCSALAALLGSDLLLRQTHPQMIVTRRPTQQMQATQACQ